jgi:hypothetical protein
MTIWKIPIRSSILVIACDKREAFAQGSACDEAIQLTYLLYFLSLQESWIASLSLSSGGALRRPVGSQ